MEANVENTTASKICRACLSRDEPFMKLFDMNYSSLTDEKLTLCEMLASVAYLEVHLGDGLPDVICQSCAEKVNVAHNFRTLCKRSDAYLRETAMDSGYYFETEESHIHLVKKDSNKYTAMEAVENTTASKICRACLSRDEPFMKLFDMNYSSLTDEKLTLCEMLASVAYLEVHLGDGLPDVICQSCAEKVNIAYNFRTLCKRSDAFLREAAMDSGHYFEMQESHIHLSRMQNIKEEKTDCLDITHSTESEGGVIPNNTLTSTEPILIHSNTLTQDLNLTNTGQFKISEKPTIDPEIEPNLFKATNSGQSIKIKESSQDHIYFVKVENFDMEETDCVSGGDVQSICQDVTKNVKKEPTSDSGNKPIMSMPNKNSDIKTIMHKKKPGIEAHTSKSKKNLSGKNTVKCNTSKSSKKPKIEKMSDDSSKEDNDSPDPVKQKIHPCIICSQTFKRRSELIAHKKTHPADMKHQCPHCEKIYFNIYSFKKHVITHSDTKEHVCTICDKSFHLPDGLRKHMMYHKGIRPHACQFCEKRFYAPNAMRAHVRCMHSDNQYNATCNVCGKKFKHKMALAAHLRIHSGQRPHICEECGKGFSQKTKLKEHFMIHTSPRVMFECECCGEKLSSKSALKVHIKHKHSTERPFACNLCTKAFAAKAALNEHQSVHTGEKPEACSLCDRKFTCKRSLRIHMRLHTGERPYSCPHCDQLFVSSSRVTEHVKSKHMARCHECPDCGKMFHLGNSLTSHMRIHRGIKRNRRKKVPSPVLVEVEQINPEPVVGVE